MPKILPSLSLIAKTNQINWKKLTRGMSNLPHGTILVVNERPQNGAPDGLLENSERS